MFFDQKMNMKMAEYRGFGLTVPYEELSDVRLRAAIRELLNNPKYTEQAQLASDRYRDQLKSPLETAIYWVKHVAKYKGAKHLRSVAVDMPYYIYYNVDCWAFIAFVIVTMLYSFKVLLSRLFRMISHGLLEKKKKLD